MKKTIRTGNTGFTAVPNGILRGKNISLRALGLYYLIFSLPDTWNFSVRGLSTLCADGVRSVRAAVTELEKAGFLKRTGPVHSGGHFSCGEWSVFETPQNPAAGSESESFKSESLQNEPAHGESFQNGTQSNNITINNSNNINPEQSITHHNNIFEMMKEEFKWRIDYEILADTYGEDILDPICTIAAEIMSGGRKTERINGCDIPLENIIERYRQIDSDVISFAIDSACAGSGEIVNQRSYWATVLFNAPVAMRVWAESEFKKHCG